MAQRNPEFLEPQRINAMRPNGESVMFDPDDYAGEFGSGDTRFRHKYFQSIFVSDRCAWDGCDIRLIDRGIPLCHEHAARVWAFVDYHESQGTKMVAQQEMLAAVKAEEAAEAARDAKSREYYRQHTTEPGTIYYLRVGDLIKIGFTTDLGRRLAQYPPNVELITHHPGTMGLELELHRRFARYCAKGREWYQPHEVILTHIQKAVEEKARVDAAQAAEREKWLEEHRPMPVAAPRPLRAT